MGVGWDSTMLLVEMGGHINWIKIKILVQWDGNRKHCIVLILFCPTRLVPAGIGWE